VFINTCYQSSSMFRREEGGMRYLYQQLYSMFGRGKEGKRLLHEAFTDIKGVSSCQRWRGRCTLADIQQPTWNSKET